MTHSEREPDPDPETDIDAAWASIVENYGERPILEGPSDWPAEPAPAPPSGQDFDEPVAEPAPDWRPTHDPEDRFVPPPPPLVPRPTPARLLAWVGLFGVPVAVLIALVAHIVLAPWLGLLLMGWFVGGFVTLIATMNDPRSGGPGDSGDSDGWDDGARL